MSSLLAMHARLVLTITAFLLLMALWGGIAALRQLPVSPWYRSGLWIGQLLIIAEAIIGGVLLLNGRQPANLGLHLIYGLVALLTLPATVLYLRDRQSRWTPAVYAAACLFLAAIALRALATGRIAP